MDKFQAVVSRLIARTSHIMDGLSDWLNRSGSQRKGSRGRLNSDEELGRCLEHGSKLPSSQTRWRRDSANGDPIYEKKVDATLSRSAVFWGRIKLVSSRSWTGGILLGLGTDVESNAGFTMSGS